jgi:hypothetical protein
LTTGAKKDKNLLDTGLAANDEYFWQEVTDKYQELNDDYECLAWDDLLFDDVDALVMLPHTWSKLREIYKGLSKLYLDAFENNKKVVIMMPLLIFAVIEGRCTIYIYGCKKNHRWNPWPFLIYLMMSSMIVENPVIPPLPPGNHPKSQKPRSIWVLEADHHLQQVWVHWLMSNGSPGNKCYLLTILFPGRTKRS